MMSVTQAIPDVDETFSKLCSDMLVIVRDEETNDATDDCMSTYYGFGSGPTRACWPPRRFRVRVVGRLLRSGYTIRKFMGEVKRRTSAKWVHYGPLALLQFFVECLEDPSCEKEEMKV